MFFKVIEDVDPGWWNDNFREIPMAQCPTCKRWKAVRSFCLVCSKGVS